MTHDMNMLNIMEKVIRGGLYFSMKIKRYVKANNTYIPDSSPNEASNYNIWKC